MGINNFKAFPSPNHQDSNVWNGKDCTWGSAIPGIKTYLWPCFSPPLFCSSYLPLFQKKKKKKHAKRLQCPLLFPFIPLSLSIPSHFRITFPQQPTLFLFLFFFFFHSLSPHPHFLSPLLSHHDLATSMEYHHTSKSHHWSS